MKRVYTVLIVNFICFIQLAAQTDTTHIFSVEDKWRKHTDLLESIWNNRSETIERHWQEQKAHLIKHWASREKRVGNLYKIHFGEVDSSALFHSQLNFSNMTLSVRGVAFGNTPEEVKERAIQIAAQKLFAENLNIDVDGKKKLKDLIDSEFYKNDLKDIIINSSQIINQSVEPLQNQRYQGVVDIEQPLTGSGSVARVLNRAAINNQRKSILSSVKRQKDLERVRRIAGISPYTGIIIDARDVDFKPCMAPSIQTVGGTLLYGPMTVDKEFALEFGVASWAKTLDTAKEMERIGKSPMIIKASGKENNFTLIVDDQTAETLSEYGQNTDGLKKCKVVIIVG